MHVNKWSSDILTGVGILTETYNIQIYSVSLMGVLAPVIFETNAQDARRSPGYAVSLIAETTAGTLFSAESCAAAGTNPEDLGELTAKLLFEEISRVCRARGMRDE